MAYEITFDGMASAFTMTLGRVSFDDCMYSVNIIFAMKSFEP